MRNASLLLVLAASAAACRSNSGTTVDGGHNIDAAADANVGMVTTIKNLRMNQPAVGTIVTLQNVVVVTHLDSKKSGTVWVQDQGGGQYSGIEVYCNYGGTSPNCTMTQTQFAAFTAGQVVNVTGKFDSFLLTSAPAGAQPVLEVESPTITTSSMTATPMPVNVTSAMVAKAVLTGASDAYKGTYVHITDLTSYTNANYTAANPPVPPSTSEFYATCTGMGTTPASGNTLDGIDLTSGSTTIALSLHNYKTQDYCYPCTAAMPYPCTNDVSKIQTFTSVSGIVEPNYNSNGMVYLGIAPTTDADLTH